MNGRLEPVGDLWRLRFTRTLGHSPEKVWRAITEARHLKAWFPDEIELPSPLETGARVRFASPYRPEVFDTEIIECTPPWVLEFRWDTNDTLRFEIRPHGGGCELTLLDTFDELGKAARDAAGWHTCLDAFDADLDGVRAPASGEGDWKRVFAFYAEEFGPAASSIGPPEQHPYSE